MSSVAQSCLLCCLVLINIIIKWQQKLYKLRSDMNSWIVLEKSHKSRNDSILYLNFTFRTVQFLTTCHSFYECLLLKTMLMLLYLTDGIFIILWPRHSFDIMWYVLFTPTAREGSGCVCVYAHKRMRPSRQGSSVETHFHCYSVRTCYEWNSPNLL